MKKFKNYRITVYSRRGKVNRKVMAFEFLNFDNPEFDCALKRFKSKRELTRDFINSISCELYYEFYEFFGASCISVGRFRCETCESNLYGLCLKPISSRSRWVCGGVPNRPAGPSKSPPVLGWVTTLPSRPDKTP